MTEILCAVKGGASPKGKPRVWFTCHPADFEKYFKKICGDLFAAHDCAVYYTADMSCAIAEQNRQTDLGSNNLFVIPVTLKLLIEPNRAMDLDVPYALSNHIPVLPVMMEPGLDLIYSRPDKFGQLQYLNPFSTDATEISYAEKLKKYLISTLTDEETIRRVRSAFDAYVFLSYRKKDRRHANELMRLIHSHPECRDLAIWYDEFLTPGESFQENITRVLTDSKLFLLLVTPNLLEEPEGKPNFVMGEEYPAARKSGIGILPAQMEQTDPGLLQSKFEGLPPCVSVEDGDAFRQRLLNAVETLSDPGNDGDPEHLYLMGIAYLNGIDVETDRTRGLELITQAAEADLPEAMDKLYQMYESGQGIRLDYQEALYWADRLATHYKNTLGEDHVKTLAALGALAMCYNNMGKYDRAVEILEHVYASNCEIHGQKHEDTLTALNNLACCYTEQGKYTRASALLEKAYALQCELMGEEDPKTISTLGNLAVLYSNQGDYNKALEVAIRVQQYLLAEKGEEAPQTLTSLNNLAHIYGKLEKYDTALELYEKVYVSSVRVLGREHPKTIAALNNVAYMYGAMCKYEIALEKQEQVYEYDCKVLGKNHPSTLRALNNLANIYVSMGDHKIALEKQKQAYELMCAEIGEEHPNTMFALGLLSDIYSEQGNHKKALELREREHRLFCKVYGKEDPKTITVLSYLANSCAAVGKHKRALELHKEIFDTSLRVLGQEHPQTLKAMNGLVYATNNWGAPIKAFKLGKRCYSLCCDVLGQTHPDALVSLINLAAAHNNMGDGKIAMEFNEKAYALCRSALGEEHTTTLTALNNMAHYIMLDGDRERAVELYTRVHQLCIKVYGPEHLRTRQTWETLRSLRKA